MAKHKNRLKNPAHAPTPHRAPSAAATPAHSEPTPKQIERLDSVASQVEALSAEHGPPDAQHIAEQVGPTLEESLKRTEELLIKASAYFSQATDLKDKNERAEKSLIKREQEHADKITKENNEMKKQASLLVEREAELKEKEDNYHIRHNELLQKSNQLIEREHEATRGFTSERRRILGSLEDERNLLRDERDHLEEELADARERAEREHRARAMTRAQQWAEEDAARTHGEAENRRQFDEEMTRMRQEALNTLRIQLESAREENAARVRADQDRAMAMVATREAEIEGLEDALRARLREQRAAELDLQAEQEMLEEDRAGLDRRVDRLVNEHTENLRHNIVSLQRQLDDTRAQRDTYFNNIESRQELDRRFGGRTPEDILSALQFAERERDTLKQQLLERPDEHAAERLSRLEFERSAWLEEQAVLQGDLARANGELATRRLSAIELETLRKQKEALEVHKQLLDGAVDELRVSVEKLTRQEDNRDPMTALTSLDKKEEFQAEERTSSPFNQTTETLKAFADDLRHRIAKGVEGRTLYYSARDVRSFLGGLAMTRLMLLQGISGTGKTSLPLAFASAVGGGIEIVEVQAGWRDRQDLLGYYNAFHRHYYATNFLQALYKAGTPAYSDRLFLMVLDEINLSRPEQFFADFLSALEQPIESRRLTLVNDPLSQAPKLMVDGRHLPIPPNVWFIGTANHDESTAEFADKTYDRAHLMEMPRKTETALFDVQDRNKRAALSYQKLEAAFNDAAKTHEKDAQRATKWLREASFTANLQRRFRVGWGNRLENQLARYLPVVVASGGSIGEAMDHLLVTKVFRKLKDRHDVRATALEELSIELQTAWEQLDPENPPERCVALIEQEIAAKQGEDFV
jgi:hypothetical protein